MKKLLSILFLIYYGNSFGQGFPSNPTQGNPNTKNIVMGAWEARKGMVVGVYSDTSSANSDTYTKGVPYITITTTSGRNVLWQRNSTATQWVQMSGGGGGGYDYSGKLDSVRRLSDLTVVEYSGSPSAVIANPIYKDSVGVTALFRSVGTDSVYAVINGLAVYQFKDSSGSSGSDSTAYVNGLVVNDSTLRLYRFNGDSSDFEIKGNGIPITGTNPATGPVTGDIEMSEVTAIKGTSASSPWYLGGTDQIRFVVGAQPTYIVVDPGPDLEASTGIGLRGGADFTANITDLDYPQKKYVDSVAGTTYDSTIVATAGQEDFVFTSVPSDYSKYRIFINGCEIEPVTYFTTLLNTISFIGPLQEGDRVRYWRIK